MESNTTDNLHFGANAIVLTHDGRILLQQRTDYDVIGRFGGGAEEGETDPRETLARELKEELGATVDITKLVLLTDETGPTLRGDLVRVHTYFWHDSENTITGCYEGLPAYFTVAAEALAHPTVRDNAKRGLQKAVELGFLA